jgi:polyisoprenoid-binding protein YceI
MRYFLALFVALGLLVVPTGANAVGPPADSVTYQFDNANSTMTVYGSSNVRDWDMNVTQIDGSVQLADAEEKEEGPALPSIQNIQVEIPVQKMESSKDRLQRHAHDALKKEEYPTISFSASDVDVSSAAADSFSVVANGDLTIKGNTHSVTLSAKGVRQSDGTLRVVGGHELKLSTFEVERPSLMFGAIKVDDPVRVGFDVVLTPRAQ